MLTDPITDMELGAILAVLVFSGWWFSPAQRSHRRREAARARVELRRAPGGPMAIVWELAGSLSDVVAGLLALPAPDQPTAPRLVRGAAPRLWTP